MTKKSIDLFNLIEKMSIKEKPILEKEISETLKIDIDKIKRVDANSFGYYSLFSIEKEKVDDLILIAKSKESFEEASNILLSKLNEKPLKEINNQKVKNLLKVFRKEFM